YGGCE
ncbi:hypothetical protein A2U01_0057597, partial [Trifolium medium]